MTSSTYNRFAFISLSCLVFASLLPFRAAASDWSPLDARDILGRAQSVTQETYPDADEVVLGRQGWVRYEQDGTSVELFEQYTKVLTEKGRRDACTLTSSFTIPYNTTRFVLVEVIGSDGGVRKVDIASNSREMVDPGQISSNIYNPNDRLLQVTIPGVSIGDTIHFVIEDHFTKARMPGTYSDYITFEGTEPILYARHTIVAPLALPLASIAIKNEIPGTVTFLKTHEPDRIVYQWTARDVPQAFEEPEMPPLYTQAQKVLVSTIADWREISRWYWGLARPQVSSVTPEMRAEVRRIVKGRRASRPRIEAIFFWVSRNVRYLGITAEAQAPGYEPHPASMTFERRAGVCRDKAALLVAMLRIAGIEAYPVLIMNGPRMDPEVPQPFFNHAIACARNPDGSYILMDPTDESTSELFPAYLGNKSYLVATPKGETLRTSPVVKAERNSMHIVTKGTLDAKGTLRASTQLTFGGINDNAYRAHLARLSLEETRAFFEKALLLVLPRATLEEAVVEPSDMQDTTRGLKATLTYRVDGYHLQGPGINSIRILRFGDTLGLVPSFLKRMGLKERKYPFVTETTCGVDESLALDVDPSLGEPTGAPPPDEETRDDGFTWRRTCTMWGRTLVFEDVFLLEQTEYSPGAYKRLQDTLARREKANRYMPVLDCRRVSGARRPWYEVYSPDAVIVSDTTRVTVLDRQTVAETVERTVKVLTYAGVKQASELHVPFIPAWEEVRLEEAFVRSADGVLKTVDPREVNLMDQAWSGSAVRYPAGKILVVSFPGVGRGSIITYRYTRKRSGWPDWMILVPFQADMPIERRALRIDAAPGMDIRILKKDNGLVDGGAWKAFPDGFIEESRYVADGRNVYEFSAQRVQPISPEDNLPPAFTFAPVVLASATSPGEFSARVGGGLAEAARKGSFAGAKALELCRGLADDSARISAVRDYIARHVRNVDIPFAAHHLEMVSAADETLSSAYGHQADRAVLAYAMLSSLGFEPRFVLASRIPGNSPVRDVASSMPSRDWFDAVLVKVPTEGGDVYVGDTDQYAEVGVSAHQGMCGLDVTDMTWSVIGPADPARRNRTETHVTVELDAGGNALVTYARDYSGMDAAVFLKAYVEMTPEEKRRRFQEIVSQVSRSAEPKGPYEVVTDRKGPRESFTLAVPALACVREGILTLDVPGLVRRLAFVASRARRAPLSVQSEGDMSVVVEVRLPEETATVISAPVGTYRADVRGIVEIESRGEVRMDGGQGRVFVLMEQRIRTRPGTVWPADYDGVLAVHDRLAAPGSCVVMARLREKPRVGGVVHVVPIVGAVRHGTLGSPQPSSTLRPDVSTARDTR